MNFKRTAHEEDIKNGFDMHLPDDLEVAIELKEVDDNLPTIPGSNTTICDGEENLELLDWENGKNHSFLIAYLKDKLTTIPGHSGTTTVGCEKAISYLRKLDKELSEAVRGDEDNKVDELEAEDVRGVIYEYISRLEEAYSSLMGKYKKKSALSIGKQVVARINDGVDIQYFISVGATDGEETLLRVDVVEPTDDQVAKFSAGEKNSISKSATAKVYLVEDPFLSSITRLLIAGHVTHGRDMNELYGEFKEKYSFTPREELSIHELLYQKNFPLAKDLGRLGEEEILLQDGLGVDYSTEYFG